MSIEAYLRQIIELACHECFHNVRDRSTGHWCTLNVMTINARFVRKKMHKTTTRKGFWLVDKKSLFFGCCVFALVGCSNGGSGSDDRDENTLPSIQLNDGDVLSNGNSVIRIPASDDTGIATVSARLLRQGQLEECRAELDFTLVRNSLFEACLADQPTCSVDFIPTANEVVVYPPPLYAPIGLEYELSFIDRDGSATDPTTAVFCFDVGQNTAPEPATDTYQLIYPGFIQKGGVNYTDRCEKTGGSDGVLANDDDDEHITNSCLTAELVDLPQFASNLSTFRQSFRSNGGFRYEGFGDTPTSTMDSFSYRVTDGVNPVSDPITVQIIFSGENLPPVATDDSFVLAEDNPSQELNVLANDSDPDALPLSVTSVFNGPANGVANIRNGVVIDYIPNANFSGLDQFSYSITDSGGLVASANVSLSVSGVNDPPVASNDVVTTSENVALEINVLGNDADPEGDTLSVSAIATPANGSAVISSSGQIFYTPDANFSGLDPFEYTISDSNGGNDTATVVVTVNFVNVPPVANEDNLTVDEGSVATIDVLANDTDGDGDTLVVVELVQPANGVAEIVSDSVVRYTPNNNFNGADSFRYRVSDGATDSWAQVSVNVGAVNDVPVAVDDSIGTDENNPVVIGVTGNDTDPDGDFLTISAVTQGRNGTVAIATDGRSVIYTPSAQFSGVDTFTYTVTDGNGGTDTAKVTVQVTDTNGAPVAANDSASTPEDSPVTIDVLSNDTDPDGDSLTLSVVTNASNGTAAVSGSAIIYTPDSGFDGSDSFTYRVTDIGGLSATAQVVVTVSNVNASPVAADDSVGVNENTAISVDVLANDTDPDGDALSILSVGTPANGTAVIQGGVIRYAPATDFSGSDQFTYRISDGNGGTDNGSVVVTVSNVNRPPVAVDDVVSNEQDDAVSIAVLVNDSDPDGDSISVQSVTQPANGVAAIAPSSMRVVYRPDAGFVGSDTFQYTVVDSNLATSTATVTVSVTSVNAPPVAVPDSATTLENVAVSIDVTANDTDPNGDAIVLASVTQPANGSVVTNAGDVTYTPATDFTGVDTFTYVINDGTVAQATGVVTVTVQADTSNNDPVAADDLASSDTGVAVDIDVLVNDTDSDGDPLTVASTTQPANGLVTLVAGIVTYTSDTAFVGTDSFQYTISDGNGGSDTASVSIDVSAVSVPPVAVDDTGTTDQNVSAQFPVLSNDTFANLASVTLSITTQATNGVATVVGNTISYAPAADYSGTDVVEYTILDAGGSDSAMLSITVNAVATNTPPVAANDIATTLQDTPITVDVLINDSDIDLDPLTVAITTLPLDGVATLAGDQISYTPNNGFFGQDSVGYAIDDGNGGTDTAVLTITITEVPVVSNRPPVAVDDAVSTAEDTTVIVKVLDNDSDPDNDTLAVAVQTQPGNGGLEVRPNRRILYTPVAGFSGIDTFVYAIDDGNGATATATVTVTVIASI